MNAATIRKFRIVQNFFQIFLLKSVVISKTYSDGTIILADAIVDKNRPR